MKTKKVTREYLEHKINCINADLMNFHHETTKLQQLEAIRNQYVEKFIEMEKYDLQTIEIECYERKSNS
ncbi:hypothetical protein CAPN002_06110 [Capnocytophaga stomatis]|uniref:hypothetical protein n=1 Tax=Capnocytophaga stomatis TaxID=1848904 RepID=UPI00194EFDE5|nr:hypothetical protein [Capnocytophaga stomatis]GIJ93393.1 hypothetical protein CAPN002_06110 [Capnocytophaga stomatis]